MMSNDLRIRGADVALANMTEKDREEQRQENFLAARRFAVALENGVPDARQERERSSSGAAPSEDFPGERTLVDLIHRSALLGWRLSVDLTDVVGHRSSVHIDLEDDRLLVLLQTEGEEIYLAWKDALGPLRRALERRPIRPFSLKLEWLQYGEVHEMSQEKAGGEVAGARGEIDGEGVGARGEVDGD